MVKYFIKSTKIHKYPAPKDCYVKYTGETLLGEPPAGYEKCDHCFGLPR